MDVDPPRSPIKRAASPLASSSLIKRTKTLLSDAQLAALVNRMKILSESLRWREIANDDLSPYVLILLTSELASTNMGETFISSPNLDGALAVLKTFTQNELDQWENGIRNGVENNDWNDLIMHRKYISDSQISHLILLAAKLQIAKMPGVALEHVYSDPQEKGMVVSKILIFLVPTDCAPQPQRLLGDLGTLEKQQKPYGCTSRTTTIPTTKLTPSFVPLSSHRGWGSREPPMSSAKHIS